MFYVYELRDETEAVFYVGMGKGKRAYTHRARARAGSNTRRAMKIREIWERGSDYTAVIVFKSADENEAFSEEKRLIAYYGRDNLMNSTDGGKGLTNPPQDARDKIAAGRRGIKISEVTRQRLVDSHLGNLHTPESKAKVSATLKTREQTWVISPHTDEYKAKMSEALKGRIHKPESIAKMKASKMGHVVTQETRDKISATKRSRNA